MQYTQRMQMRQASSYLQSKFNQLPCLQWCTSFTTYLQESTNGLMCLSFEFQCNKKYSKIFCAKGKSGLNGNNGEIKNSIIIRLTTSRRHLVSVQFVNLVQNMFDSIICKLIASKLCWCKPVMHSNNTSKFLNRSLNHLLRPAKNSLSCLQSIRHYHKFVYSL